MTLSVALKMLSEAEEKALQTAIAEGTLNRFFANEMSDPLPDNEFTRRLPSSIKVVKADLGLEVGWNVIHNALEALAQEGLAVTSVGDAIFGSGHLENSSACLKPWNKVKEIASALQAVTQQLFGGMREKACRNAYAGSLLADPQSYNDLAYKEFVALVAFYQEASSRNRPVLVWIH
jgi:Domain of unknown function (DUF1877)